MQEEEIRELAQKLRDEGRGKEAFLLLDEHGLLEYCPRLHLKAFKLPCGERGECEGGECPKRPAKMKFRHHYNHPHGY